VVTVFVCGFAFVVANYIIPVANLKFTTLLYDIRVAKPAFDIKEGIFYDKLPNYAIKVGKKDKDGNGIYDIVIYENDYRMQDNINVAEKGRMSISPDKKFLEFYLQNGWRYQERGPFNSKETDFIRIGFKDYKKVFDLSSFELLKTPDSAFKTNWQMLNVKQLDKASDSMIRLIKTTIPTRIRKEAMNFLISGKAIDSGWASKKVIMPDSITSYKQLLPDSVLTLTYNRSMEKSGLIKYSLDLIDADYQKKRSDLRHHLIEWHRKFALSFACMVLFFIGAPLGSIIRKGGLGMPLVIAVVFFLIFHLLNMFGIKFAENDVTTPLLGMWLSTLILIPIGFFFTYKAMHDSQLFNQEFYFRAFRKMKSFVKK